MISSRTLSMAGQYLFLGVMAFLSIFPFIWMMISSTNTSVQIMGGKVSLGSAFATNVTNFFTLVDVPLVRPSTVAEVITAWRRTRAPIVRPASGELHGHPVMFDRSIFADLRAADPNTGAKAVFAIHRDRIVNVEVKDAGAFEDIDTPADYRKVLGS